MAYKPFDINDPFKIDNTATNQADPFIINEKLYHPKREQLVQILSQSPDFKNVSGQYKHIGQNMLKLCGHPNFDKYISLLLNDTREGARQGFPDAIGTSLMRLSSLHDSLMTR